MLTNTERAFLKVYAAMGCVNVAAALVELGLGSEQYRAMCDSPDFTRELHSMFASLEMAPPNDPFDFAPQPPVVMNNGQFAVDPFGPLLGSFAYDHVSRRFSKDTKMSDLSPSDVSFFNTAAIWRSVDRSVAGV